MTESFGLQVEVELGPNYKFHSIFSCPVSREQATPANPPMLPYCGHVLCKATMEKLAKVIYTEASCCVIPAEKILGDHLSFQMSVLSYRTKRFECKAIIF